MARGKRLVSLEFEIKPLEESLLKACAEIAKQAPDPWSLQNLQEAINNPHRQVLVALQGEKLLAFACFFRVPKGESVDLEMLVSHPEMRRKGIAAILLNKAMELLFNQGVKQCLLEVRKSNMAAICLYTQCGFKQLALRTNMYANPVEDGLLMAKSCSE